MSTYPLRRLKLEANKIPTIIIDRISNKLHSALTQANVHPHKYTHHSSRSARCIYVSRYYKRKGLALSYAYTVKYTTLHQYPKTPQAVNFTCLNASYFPNRKRQENTLPHLSSHNTVHTHPLISVYTLFSQAHRTQNMENKEKAPEEDRLMEPILCRKA